VNGGGKPIKEFAFLEIRDDRGSSYIRKAIEEAADFAKRERATLLYVEFGLDRKMSSARWHPEIKRFIESRYGSGSWDRSTSDGNEDRYLALMPEPIPMDGIDEFDPFEYFAERRYENLVGAAAMRSQAMDALRKAMRELPPGPALAYRIAMELNRNSTKTANGRSWTGPTVSKAIQDLKSVDRIRELLGQIPEGPEQYEKVAQVLNTEGIKHYSRKPWTVEMVDNTINRKIRNKYLA
jgi:hypothetical protein